MHKKILGYQTPPLWWAADLSQGAGSACTKKKTSDELTKSSKTPRKGNSVQRLLGSRKKRWFEERRIPGMGGVSRMIGFGISPLREVGGRNRMGWEV